MTEDSRAVLALWVVVCGLLWVLVALAFALAALVYGVACLMVLAGWAGRRTHAFIADYRTPWGPKWIR